MLYSQKLSVTIIATCYQNLKMVCWIAATDCANYEFNTTHCQLKYFNILFLDWALFNALSAFDILMELPVHFPGQTTSD